MKIISRKEDKIASNYLSTTWTMNFIIIICKMLYSPFCAAHLEGIFNDTGFQE